jgi:Fibronectin type III domain
MNDITGRRVLSVWGIAFLTDLAVATGLHAAALVIPADGLAAAKSGSDLVLSFPTASPGLYTVQTSPDLLGQWTTAQPGIPGDGTVKEVTITNAILAGKGFYRLLIQRPAGLLLSQSTAFSILGYWCGGIKEKAYVTGFDPTSGYPTGEVYLSTTCNGSGRGGRSIPHTAWAAVTWDLAGNVVSASLLTNGTTANPSFIATDPYGDVIYNVSAAAYLAVPTPGAPTGVTAVQSGDEFQVSWMLNGANPAAVTSSALTATPINSTASILTTIVAGPATSGVISTLQPQTTYQITVVNSTVAGSSPPSAPVTVTTSPATLLPSAPNGVSANWANLDPTGTTDTLVATWQAADPGNSPVDQYQVTIVGSDGGGTLTQTVSGTTLTTSFTVDFTPNWSVTVQGHNAAGWGAPSASFTLGGL